VVAVQSLTQFRAALRARRERRRRQERLRRELAEFRTTAERQEIDDACARYGTTTEDLLLGRSAVRLPPPDLRGRSWEDLWDEIVLELTADPDP
jgi:hypothetical protein